MGVVFYSSVTSVEDQGGFGGGGGLEVELTEVLRDKPLGVDGSYVVKRVSGTVWWGFNWSFDCRFGCCTRLRWGQINMIPI